MFPNLSDLINYLFGTHIKLPVKSYGLMLAVAFAVAAMILYHELNRLEKENKIRPKQKKNLKSRREGLMELTINFALIAAIFGIAGSKIFDIMEHSNDLIRDPAGTIFSFSGLSFYGGLIFAGVAVVYYAHRNNIRFPFIADAVAPALILAYAIGRSGCQLSGDGCWGIANNAPKPHWLGFLPDWMWSFRFPHNVINEGVLIPACSGDHCFTLPYPVFPTSFYETILGLLIFIFLWSIRKNLTIPGYLFCLYLILNGTERYFIEKIRINRMYSFLGMHMTQAEIIALILIISGIAGFWYFKRLEKKRKNIQLHSPLG